MTDYIANFGSFVKKVSSLDSTASPPERLSFLQKFLKGDVRWTVASNENGTGIFELLKPPDEWAQYSADCEKMWRMLRENFTTQIQATEQFVVKAGLDLSNTLPLYANRGWWVPAHHHPGYIALFVFFATDFGMSFDEVVEETILSRLNELAERIRIPKRFFYEHDPASYQPQAMLLYARYMYRRYLSKA